MADSEDLESGSEYQGSSAPDDSGDESWLLDAEEPGDLLPGGIADLSFEGDITELDSDREVLVEDQDEAELEELGDVIRQSEVGGSAPDPYSSDFDEDQLHDGNLHPAEYWRQGIQATNEEDFKRKDYSPETVERIDHAENQWRLYCKKILQQDDWVACFRNISFRVIHRFLEWHLCQKTGKDGRRKRRVKASKSLMTFWYNFRLAFERALFSKIDNYIDCRLVLNALAKLTKPLNHQVRPNRPMTIEDLKRQIETTLSTTEKTFALGEIRILSVLYLLLCAPAGSRPASILRMQFKHIEILLARDPENPKGAPRLVLQFTLEFTKRYLGPKAIKSFPIPEIIFDPSLLLSPHIFMLGILFRHRAFKSDILNDNPRLLYMTQVEEGENEQLVPLKPSMMERHIFCRASKTTTGLQIGEQRIERSAMAKIVGAIGRLAGFDGNTISYTLRYMAGNNMDQSVDCSTALRDSALDHAHGGNTFYQNYLNRHFRVDLMAIHRGTRPQNALLQQVTSHGHSVSKRRPVSLTDAQGEEVKQDAKYQRMTQQLSDHFEGSEPYRKIWLQRKSHLARLRKAKLEQVRKEWNANQGVEDMERQFHGKEPTRSTSRPSRPLSPAQQRMLDALTADLINDPGAQLKRNLEAIEALKMYCEEEEPRRTKLQQKQAHPPRASELTVDVPPAQLIDGIKKTTMVRVAGSKIVRCYLCVAKAEVLGAEHPRFWELCQEFSTPHALARHFVPTHLDPHSEDDAFECPVCKVTLVNKKHLQNHTQIMHGINTNIKFKRPAARRRNY